MEQQFKKVLDTPEGPEVEMEMYNIATQVATKEKITKVEKWEDVLSLYHKAGVDDQFIPPLVKVDKGGNPKGLIRDGDVVLYWDFRTDRAKPLTSSFLDIPYGGQIGGLSEKAKRPDIWGMVTMTHYDDEFLKSPKLKEAFNPAKPLEDTYVEVIGHAGVSQLVSAESEKWRAVTWFKDGRRNLGYQQKEYEGILRTQVHPELPVTVRIVDSRRVAAHSQAPKMRAKEITDVLLQGVKDGVDDIFANYANADMVGHAMTMGDRFPSVVVAIEELDQQLERLVPVALEAGYTVMLTGDHGNAEQMFHPDGKANPAHTVNPVPMIVLGLGADEEVTIKKDATIGDMAPTCLHLRGIPIPKAWDRTSFLEGTVKPEKHRKIMRLVLDGYGVRAAEDGNAMAVATKNKGSPLHMDLWLNGADNAVAAPVEASSLPCGYPDGVAGTTEFGHVLFDAGRNVLTDLVLIDRAKEIGEFEVNPAFNEAIAHVKANPDVTIHCMGILSDGLVHSSLVHIEGLLAMFASQGVQPGQVKLHPITDGRDKPGDSSPGFVTWLQKMIEQYKVGELVSIWGRGWGKDRDNRWMRIESAFRSLCEGTAARHLQFDE